MCGIIATNRGTVYGNVLALKALEYRGYDSSGFIAITEGGQVVTHKSKGNVDKLMMSMNVEDEPVKVFIGHTRWATHGKATEENSHPHFDSTGRYAIVCNGIIENFEELRDEYCRNISLQSETDTEVFINVISHFARKRHTTLDQAIKQALIVTRGGISAIVVDTRKDNDFYAIQRGVALNWFCVEKPNKDDDDYNGEYDGFYAYSYGLCFTNGERTPGITKAHGCHISYSGTVVKLGDTPEDMDGLEDPIRRASYEHETPNKGDFDTFMEKEIHEQPRCIENLLRGRIHDNAISLGGLDKSLSRHNNLPDFINILGCGSSLHAAELGQRYIEEIGHIKTVSEQAAEFRYRNPLVLKENKEMYILISQSGETADVLEAHNHIKDNGNWNSLGIVNNVGSTLANDTWKGIYTRAGIEVGVASTKTFTNQVITLLMLAVWLNEKQCRKSNSWDDDRNLGWWQELPEEIAKLPKKVDKIINTKKIRNKIKEAAWAISKADSCIFIGRGYNYPIAKEGALKLKELAYIHAEGYSAAELKHGPLALIDEQTPTVAIWNNDDQSDKLRNNIFEIQSRGGPVVLITDKEQEHFKGIQILVPQSNKYLSPIINGVVTQILAYETALILGNNVDQPRNLAKSVTVE
jgi:glucosamine--fructose-6-phosphate aminotransferase (isomerizing)